MRRLLAIAGTGVDAALRHPLRSAATVACVVALLVPWLAGVGVSRGLLDQAEEALRFGADLYVTGVRFGRPAPVPLDAIKPVRELPGVVSVHPRIVGEVVLGGRSAVLVGVPRERLPETARCVDGRLFDPAARGELVAGTQIARRLGLRVGTVLPPFYRNDEGERLSTIVGILRPDLPVWQANLLLASFDTAAYVFAQKGHATSLLVECRPGYAEGVRAAILRIPDLFGPRSDVRPSVTAREDLRSLVGRGVYHKEGVFDLHFLLAFAVGIPLVMVTSGAGLAERRRETGLLKACGWHTDEVLLRGVVESVVLAALASSLAILLAWAWLGPLDGYGVAGIFLPGADAGAAFDLPFRLAPAPALLACALAFTLVLTGTVYSTWRAATAPPSEAMR